MLKRLVTIALSLSMILVFAACGGEENALSTEYTSWNSFGDITYEIPDGYTYTEGYDNFILYEKPLNDKITRQININRIDQKEMEILEWEQSSPKEAYYAYKPAEDDPYVEFGTIAGYDSYTAIRPYAKDGQIYDAESVMLADDVIYMVSLLTVDEEQNYVEDEPLSDEEIDEYKAFIASIKTK